MGDVGALALGARIDRSAHPAHWYAGCELVIGAWSLVLAFLLLPKIRQWGEDKLRFISKISAAALLIGAGALIFTKA